VVIIPHRGYLAEVALGLWARVKESLMRMLMGLMAPLRDGTPVEWEGVPGAVVDAPGSGGGEDGGEGEEQTMKSRHPTRRASCCCMSPKAA